MKLKLIAIMIVFSMILTSCNTIGTQQYTYVGDATSTKNVVGQSTHFDFLGMGISAKGYAREYNSAIKDAFKNSPKGTNELKSVKIFKENKSWPQILGTVAAIVGYSLLMSSMIDSYDNPGGTDNGSTTMMSTVLMAGGAGLWGVNTYDFVVVAEPVQ